LSPSLRALPLTGLEFSYRQKADGYDENGFCLSIQTDDDQFSADIEL
jgi:hypothetical protein